MKVNKNVTKSVDAERDRWYYERTKKKGVIKNAKCKGIGKRLLELRGDMAREKVANAAGTSVSAISMYENGERVPRDAIKIKLAAFYKKSVQEIFFD